MAGDSRNIDDLDPRLATKCRAHLAACAAAGLPCTVTFTYLWIDSRGYARGVADQMPTIERLTGAVQAQNAAVAALNRQQVEAVQTRKAAQAAQQQREKAAAGVIDRLSRYQRPADGTVCPNDAGDALAREMWGRL